MRYNSSPSYGKADADDRADDLAAAVFKELPDDYKRDWEDFRYRVMGE